MTGGLCVPSEPFLQLLYDFEAVFKGIHGECQISAINIKRLMCLMFYLDTLGDHIWYGKGAVAMLCDQLKRMHPYVPNDIIKTYSRGRTFLRYEFALPNG